MLLFFQRSEYLRRECSKVKDLNTLRTILEKINAQAHKRYVAETTYLFQRIAEITKMEFLVALHKKIASFIPDASDSPYTSERATIDLIKKLHPWEARKVLLGLSREAEAMCSTHLWATLKWASEATVCTSLTSEQEALVRQLLEINKININTAMAIAISGKTPYSNALQLTVRPPWQPMRSNYSFEFDLKMKDPKLYAQLGLLVKRLQGWDEFVQNPMSTYLLLPEAAYDG